MRILGNHKHKFKMPLPVLRQIASILTKSEIPCPNVLAARQASGKPQLTIPPHILQNPQSKGEQPAKMPPSFSSRVKEDSQVAEEKTQWWPATPAPPGNDRWDKKPGEATIDEGPEASGIFDDL